MDSLTRTLNGWDEASPSLANWIRSTNSLIGIGTTVWVSPTMPLMEIMVGPCETSEGRLPRNHALVHPDLYSARHLPASKEYVKHMSAEPQRKVFTTTRIEWWVPSSATGASWIEVTKAIHQATQELKNDGLLSGASSREAAYDQITLHPHDEHIIVRIEIDKEVKG